MLPPAQYLSKIKPFSFLTESEISELVSGMEVSLYKKGRIIFESGERIKKFYFVREGKVGLFSGTELLGTVERDEIIEIDAPISKKSTEYTAIAMEDSIIFEFDIISIRNLLQKNQLFKDFIEMLVSGKYLSLLKLPYKSDSNLYERPVRALLTKPPVFCLKDQTLIEAIKLMNRKDVGSVIVADPEMRPIGIITHSDVLRSIEKELPLTEPVERAMSFPIITIDSTDSILDAYFKFLSYGINHLVVVENEKLIGVISIKDLIYYLEASGHFLKITKEILRSKDLEELKKLSIRIDSLIKNALSYGLNYPSISRLVTTIVDTILRKAFSGLEPISGITIILIGEYGRREFDVPLTIDLLIIGKKHEDCLPNYSESITNTGLHVRKINFCFEDVNQFLNSMSSHDLLEILDARYIFGDRITYIKFKDALRDLLRQNKFKLDIKRIFEMNMIEHTDIVPQISKGIKVASHLYGDHVSRPTWERIKILESKGTMKKELAEELAEAYITLRTVELNTKLGNRKELLDKMVHKKIIKIFAEYNLWMKNILS